MFLHNTSAFTALTSLLWEKIHTWIQELTQINNLIRFEKESTGTHTGHFLNPTTRWCQSNEF